MSVTVSSRRRSVTPSASRAPARSRAWRWWLGGIAGVLVVVALAGWMLWRSVTNDPRILEITQLSTQMQEQFFSKGSRGPMTEADAESMATAMSSIREKMEGLPEHLRPVAGMQIGRMFFSGMNQRMDDYFQAPPDERNAVLDQHIQQMEMMRNVFMRNGQGFGPPQGNAAGNGQVASNAGGPPWARGDSSEQSRDDWRKRMIDRTSPEQRGRWTEYRDAVERRRRELGMPDGRRG